MGKKSVAGENPFAAPEALYKIVIVGASGGGKSALTLQFLYEKFGDEYETTKVTNFRKKIELDGADVQLDILDSDADQDYADIIDRHVRSGIGFLCLFSITEEETFQATQELREKILHAKKDEQIPFLLVGNKGDLYESRKVSLDEAQDRANQWDVPYVEISTKTKENVDKAFYDLARLISERKPQPEEQQAEAPRPNNSKTKSCTII